MSSLLKEHKGFTRAPKQRILYADSVGVCWGEGGEGDAMVAQFSFDWLDLIPMLLVAAALVAVAIYLVRRYA